jgi:membrane-bound ClpP family serine protease
MQQPEPLTTRQVETVPHPISPEQAARLMPLIAAFQRSIARQQQRDGEIIARLVRALSHPTDDAARLRSIIKQIAQERT